MAITLATMRQRVRQRADMEESEFVQDAEINQYINSSYQELYDLLVNSFEDYYTLPAVSFSISSGSDYYSLPSDFYKLKGVDALLDGNNYYTLLPFDFLNRNRNTQNLYTNSYAANDRRYRIVGSRLYITPQDDAAGNYRIWYIPVTTTLSSDGSTLDGINGWEEYIVVDAARKCLLKEESDISGLVREKAELRQRIIESAARRDAGMPKTISDVNQMPYLQNRRVF